MMGSSGSQAMITEAVVWTLAPLAIIVVSLRFYTRAFIVRRIGWDDWIMLLATVRSTITKSIVVLLANVEPISYRY